MRIIYKDPDKAPEVREVDNTLKALQDCVGGYIETVPLTRDVVIICNEEGRLLGLPPNPVMGGDFIGPVLLVGVKGDEFTDLTDRQVNTLMRYIGCFEEEYPCET